MTTREDAVDALDEALMCADVEVGFPERRTTLAIQLAAEGVTANDIELLADHVRKTAPEASRAKILSALLRDPERRTPRLEDLRAVSEAKAKRNAERTRAPGDNAREPGPMEGEDPASWSRYRKCRIAWCRFNSDRRTEEEVARELGVPLEEIGDLLKEGREMSRWQGFLGQPPPKVTPPVKRPKAKLKLLP